MKKTNKDEDLCNVKRCRQFAIMGYIHGDHHYRVCTACWVKHCHGEHPFNLKADGILLLSREE